MTPPGEGKKYLKKEKIFLQRKRKTEKEKEGNICRSEKYFCRGKERRNIFGERKKKHFFGGEGKRRRKGRKIFGEGKNVFLCGGEEELRKKILNFAEEKKNREGEYFFSEEKKTKKEKEENIMEKEKLGRIGTGRRKSKAL